jgi:hypothetical protein
MAFSAGELDNIANAALDFYLNKGEAFQQALQSRPLVKLFEGNSKTFPGGKGKISLAIQLAYGAGGSNDSLKGYTHNDTVVFYNPANIKRAEYTWREHHIGIEVTHTELKHDGISVDDNGGTSEHSGRDMTALVNLWENKLFDFGERYARSLNDLLWGDGTSDAKALAGIRALIAADPTTGTVGGVNRATAANKLWRNRARTAAYAAAVVADSTVAGHGGDAVTSDPDNGGALWQVLQAESRQLRKYGGQPNKFLAGSDFIGALEVEMRANGYYSQNGFKKAGDGAMGPMLFDGTVIEYDPTLDDLNLAKRGYWFDTRHIYLMKMQNEWRKTHKPARPVNQFVLNRSITSTGQLVGQQFNSALVIDIK